ncbi:7TM GPCR, serpentine receptor class r (Str) family-containing protein [Strongyloides ratti]|uniref:7TM GPCR, serpentine receptor class r (Str) family-containing protein n=1 Tax=Strongyloides ratti TaxID=34506 RepID=A0A090LJY2_STRRB|nr:7TM GPCR, serpentine receptor class r (Str) family-containing protein [Strongyloides ratti]CEF70107.1 7TM GPCR, serpentine receptor class r (Str) family-containing protein [Strongyloides ratti]
MEFFKQLFDIINLILTILLNTIAAIHAYYFNNNSNINEFLKLIYYQSIISILLGIIIYVFKMHIFAIKGYFIILFDFFDTVVYDLTWNRFFFGLNIFANYSNIGYPIIPSLNIYLMCGSIILFFVINYILIFVLYIQYHLYIKTYSSIMSSYTKKMHKKFNKLLLIQSVVPIIMISIPILFYIFTLYFNVYKIRELIGTFFHQIISTVGFINPLIYLLSSKKNGNIFFKQMLCSILKKCSFKSSNKVDVLVLNLRNKIISNNLRKTNIQN